MSSSTRHAPRWHSHLHRYVLLHDVFRVISYADAQTLSLVRCSLSPVSSVPSLQANVNTTKIFNTSSTVPTRPSTTPSTSPVENSLDWPSNPVLLEFNALAECKFSSGSCSLLSTAHIIPAKLAPFSPLASPQPQEQQQQQQHTASFMHRLEEEMLAAAAAAEDAAFEFPRRRRALGCFSTSRSSSISSRDHHQEPYIGLPPLRIIDG